MNHKIISHWCKWRPQEREAFDAVFGRTKMTDWQEKHWLEKIGPDDVCFMMPSPQHFVPEMYETLLHMQSSLPTKRIINRVESLKCAFDKESNLERWRELGVRCPRFFGFDSKEDFLSKLEVAEFKFPMLLRVTNESSGHGSALVKSKDGIKEAFEEIESFSNNKAVTFGLSKHKFIAVEFLDTKRVTRSNKNFSYRLIVSGEELVTGYARVSLDDNWNATTADMNMPFEQVAENFVLFNSVLHTKMRDPAWSKKIVNAVRALELDIASVDVIEDVDGEPVFLEVNHSWDAGYNDCLPPFYNPNKVELRNFILSNSPWFEKNLPIYWYFWLNKRLHFDKVFRACKALMEKDGRLKK